MVAAVSDPRACPEWVKVWAWYRKTRGEHHRPFPQQLEAREFSWASPPLDYDQTLNAWRGGSDRGEAFLEFLAREAA